jgi:hypothetical protein
MYWTSELEAAVRADGVQGLAGYEKKCTAQLQELVKLVSKFDISRFGHHSITEECRQVLFIVN